MKQVRIAWFTPFNPLSRFGEYRFHTQLPIPLGFFRKIPGLEIEVTKLY